MSARCHTFLQIMVWLACSWRSADCTAAGLPSRRRDAGESPLFAIALT
jgi:hypothetical protein